MPAASPAARSRTAATPDGQWIAYTTWGGEEGGHVWKIPASGGTPQQLTTSPSEYAQPVWSLDGSEIVVTRGSGAAARARSATQNPYWELWRVPTEGGSQERIMTIPPAGPGGLLGYRRQITRASFGPGGRIYLPAGREAAGPGGTALMSARMDGSDPQVHATIPFGDEFVISPNGKVASLHGAVFLGAQQDIGSIEVGKLADILVLNSNPLDNIRNTTDIMYVVQGGIVRDGMTLDEVWPNQVPYGEHWWVNPASWRMDDRPVDYWDRRR